jgi:hypothetical protein
MRIHQDIKLHPKRQVPALLRFLGLNMLLGSAIGIAFVSVILLADIGGLKDLIAQSDEPIMPLFLVYAFNAFTFSGVTMGIAIMTLPYDDPQASPPPPHQQEKSEPSMTLANPDSCRDETD